MFRKDSDFSVEYGLHEEQEWSQLGDCLESLRKMSLWLAPENKRKQQRLQQVDLNDSQRFSAQAAQM